MRSEEELRRAPYVEKTFSIVQKELMGKVLDLGCADGIFSYKHKNVIGLDILEERYVEFYKLSDGKFLIPLIRGNMHKLPFRKSSFDCVLINHTLEHTNRPNDVLKEVNRILKPKGKIIIGVPNSYSIQALTMRKFFGTDFYAYVNEHKSNFSFLSLKNMLIKNGFEKIKEYKTAFHVHIIGKMFELPVLRKTVQNMAKKNKEMSQDIILVGIKNE